MRTAPKPIADCFTLATMEALTNYNTRLSLLWAARTAAERERDAIQADALTLAHDAATLKRRADAGRLAVFQADIDELRLLQSLPGLDVLVRKDWEVEAERLARVATQRERELEKQFKKIGLTDDQLDASLNQDKAWGEAVRQQSDAQRNASSGIFTIEEAQRRDELERAIQYAAARL